MWGWVVLVAASALLAACDGIGKTAEDRITAAVPPGAEILGDKAKLDALAKALAFDGGKIDGEYQARLKVRALECAHGYKPGAFAGEEGIRAALTDKDCFAKADAALRQWLGLRRVGLLLAAPPLRPLPTTAPATIEAAEFITEVNFAERAGIAVAQMSHRYQVLDIAGGKILHEGQSDGSPVVSISPNGRLFIANRREDAEVREAETGETLAVFPSVQAYQFHWVGDVGAIYRPGTPTMEGKHADPVFLDFVSGQETTLPMGGHDVDRVLPLPGTTSRYAVLTFNRVATVELQQGERGWQARLLSERVLSYGGWNRVSTLTADGRTFFGTQGALNLLSMDALGTRTVTLEPLRLTSALATPDPDQLILTGFFKGGGGAGAYAYSIGQRTLAKIDIDQLPSARLLYIPSLRRNAVIAGSRVVMLDRLPAEAPVDANEYIEQREGELATLARTRPPAPLHAFANEQEATAALIALDEFPAHVAARMRKQHGITDAMVAKARLEQAQWRARQGQGQARPGATITRAPPLVKGPVADLGKTADIHALGVYEGEEVGQVRGASNRTGTVRVHVRRTQRPIILALSAYEPVRWVLTVEPDAKLAAVLSSGYSQQEILGAGNARVYDIGRAYAYKRGDRSYSDLDSDIARWTGKRIGAFQGKYRAGVFVVGR